MQIKLKIKTCYGNDGAYNLSYMAAEACQADFRTFTNEYFLSRYLTISSICP